MNCLVTGASGFIGANLVHELVGRGHRVRVLVREGSDLRGLGGVDCERVPGDLGDRGALREAMAGCAWCFHVAASYRLWMRDYRPMWEANVEGTRNVLDAGEAAGCERIVYTSTVGCIGRRPRGGCGLADETVFPEPSQLGNPYKRSKWEAERLASERARRGVPVVIVNPSAPVGARDVKPTPTGRVIVDVLNRAMPAYLRTGLNWVHVRDVAVGHILAAERGGIGERYILGNASGNLLLGEMFAMLGEIAGVPVPRVRVPYLVAWGAAWVSEAVASVTGRPPLAPMAGVRMARHPMFFDPSKAIRDLGLPQTPVEVALADAVAWFRENGYVGPGALARSRV